MLAAELREVVVAERVISVPAMPTEPDVGLSSPARMCISVDLPEPDGPITAVALPGAMFDRDAAQGVDRRVPFSVAAGHVASDDDGPVVGSRSFLPAPLDREVPNEQG